MSTRIALILVLLSVGGCSVPISTTTRPASYYEPVAVQTDSSSTSLFKNDSAVLSDEAIARVLGHRYQAPPLSRVALMPFGREVWSSWSEELARASAKTKTNVVTALRASPRIYDVSFLPDILIPEHKSVPHLRQAAARYQADLLLIYRTDCRSFDRYRLFAADESRSHCSVEAVLLDTRTGLVPFTSVVSESFQATQTAADINFRETVLKAQLDASARALATVADELRTFMARN
ncbi:MAG: hypothetical protein AB8G16_13985 [Gammaproteobacteria bacterium]